MDVIRTIDINCDLGEGMSNDAELMKYISSCNIACGGHFGSKDTIREAILLAKKHNVKVGAHPSYPDKEHFGRKRMEISSTELVKSLSEQIQDFLIVCEEESVSPHHVKLHGALYNESGTSEKIAKTVAKVFDDLQLSIPVYSPANSVLSKNLRESIPHVVEAFIDRRYKDDGSLVSRNTTNALISSPKLAWHQLKQLYYDQEVTTLAGKKISLHADTYCLHGDAENALEIARFIRTKLNENDITLGTSG